MGIENAGARPPKRKEVEVLKKILESWNRISLVKQICLGLAVGILLALVAPKSLSGITILGDLFVGALKAVAPMLVFFLVASALCHHRQGQRTNMKSIIVLYLAGTFLAGLMAVLASFLFPVQLVLAAGQESVSAPEGLAEVLRTLVFNLVSNPITALANANYIGILAWALVLGLALKNASEGTKTLMEDVANALSVMVRWVIRFAPLGVMGLVFNAIAASGADGIMIHSRKKDPAEIFEFVEKYRAKNQTTPIVVVPTSFNTVTEEEFKARGVNVVIYANQLTRTGFPAMQNAAKMILKNHRAKECDDICMPFKDIIRLIPEE